MAAYRPTYLPGIYMSPSGEYRAELRKAGFDEHFGCKMVRHYRITTAAGQIVGTELKLAGIERIYP